jgi:hypothetical protein
MRDRLSTFGGWQWAAWPCGESLVSAVNTAGASLVGEYIAAVRESAEGSVALVGIDERHAADYALRNLQQHLVQLSAQADLKASIVMTVSAVLIGVGAARASNDDLLWGLIGFVIVLAGALLWAVLAIVPGKGGPRVLPDLFFFADIAAMSREEYSQRVTATLAEEGRLYRAMIDNLHDHAAFLVQHKYRYLRYSYAWFAAAFVVGALGVIAKQIFG